MADTKNKLFLIATIQTKPEYFQQAKLALEGIIPATLQEPGCHVFSAFESKTASNTLNLFECFEDEDALNEHYSKDYTRKVFQQYEEWLSTPVEVTKMSATSPVSWKQFHE
ncbi:putative quinol monooxygenase [Ruegeria sp. MALMAid1280]|uniref:putative quinol monooxygenase n=1 Tax=Ruegeria sp. MALMAid1280 TaxID=3411634 RepID=UPI003B9E50AA